MSITNNPVASRGRAQGAAVLAELMNYRRIKDEGLGVRLGVSRVTVRQYRMGLTPLTLDRLYELVEILNVKPELFFMEPNDALSWVVENRPNRIACSFFNLVEPDTNYTAVRALFHLPGGSRTMGRERRKAERLLIDRTGPIVALETFAPIVPLRGVA